MQFHATLEQSGKTATGIRVPPDIVEQLGSGKRPAVHVTIRGHSYRSTIAPMSGAFMLPVSAEIRGITGVAAGDGLDAQAIPYAHRCTGYPVCGSNGPPAPGLATRL